MNGISPNSSRIRRYVQGSGPREPRVAGQICPSNRLFCRCARTDTGIRWYNRHGQVPGWWSSRGCASSGHGAVHHPDTAWAASEPASPGPAQHAYVRPGPATFSLPGLPIEGASYARRGRGTGCTHSLDERRAQLRRGLGGADRRDPAQHRGDRPRRPARAAQGGGALAADRLRVRPRAGRGQLHRVVAQGRQGRAGPVRPGGRGVDPQRGDQERKATGAASATTRRLASR